MPNKYVVAVDVGTLSARACIIDIQGSFSRIATHKLSIRRFGELVFEQSTENIWEAVCHAVRAVISESKISTDDIIGIGFDATCSLVLLDSKEQPIEARCQHNLSLVVDDVQPVNKDLVYNVIMWCDHRAVDQVEQIIATSHESLRYLGERMSVEANPGKLRWIQDNFGESFLRDQVSYIGDLTDFLTYRASGSRARSLNTAATKFLYKSSEGSYASSFYKAIGLNSLVDDAFSKLDPKDIRPAGSFIGRLTPEAAKELGLPETVCVGAGLVDAYAGYVGSIAMSDGAEETNGPVDFKSRIGMICGTSICALSEYAAPKFVRGVWGPFERAIFDEPSSWYLSGGQSSAGSALDFLVRNHASYAEFERRGGYETLVAYIKSLANLESASPFYDSITRELHVYPDFHGNRSPLADPKMCGMISGLTLSDDYDSLAKLYLAGVQSICYQTRLLLEKLDNPFTVICASGGLSRNSVFVQQLANITGLNVLTPVDDKEPVLLGSAMVGATAAGVFSSLKQACSSMKTRGFLTRPDHRTKEYHSAKYNVFLRMLDDQLQYRKLMSTV